MRTALMLVAPILGSIAFQMSINAGYLKGLEWLIPWVWGACAALWTLWVATHEKMGTHWLKRAHALIGRGIWPIRLLTCLVVFFAVSFTAKYLFSPTHQTTAAAQTPNQQNTQTGVNNNAGNISQSGDRNTAVIGNNNKVGNTYKITQPQTSKGWLRPSNKPTPHTDCWTDQPKPSELTLFFGSHVARTEGNQVTALEISGHPMLTLKRKNGRIAISGEVFNPQDDAVVVLENNKFTTSNDAFLVDSTASTLRVTVKHLNESVLNVQYLNPNAVQITGHFHYQGLDVLVRDNETVINPGNNRAVGFCTKNVLTLFSLAGN